jgi:uncharacterized metal-binding protein YceD (DUF177 family)
MTTQSPPPASPPENTPEFSHQVNIAKLVPGPREYTIQADEKECEALCERLQLQKISRLEGKLHLELSPHAPYAVKGPCITLEGSLSARVTQTCVVSLEPVETVIETNFSGVFLKDIEIPGYYDHDADSEDSEEEEGPEILGQIIFDSIETVDLGELMTQQLSLELPEFPRKEGLGFDGYAIGNKDKNEVITEKTRENPFAVLKKLTNKDE